MKKLCILIIACSTGLAVQAQLIDTFLNGSLPGFATTPIVDGSAGGGNGVSFSSELVSDGQYAGLNGNYIGSGVADEQALLLTSTALPVGDALVVHPSINPNTFPAGALGVAISAAPTAAGPANSYDSQSLFDYAAISVNPSQNAISYSYSNGGVTGGSLVDSGSLNATYVDELVIENDGGGLFSLDYLDFSYYPNPGLNQVDQIQFNAGSGVADEVGVYADVPGADVNSLTNLTIVPISSVPEPASFKLFGLGLAVMSFAGLRVVVRPKQARAAAKAD